MIFYSEYSQVEPLVDSYIGERKDDKQFFPVFIGFLICLDAHCQPGSEAQDKLRKLIIYYRNAVVSPVLIPATKFVEGIEEMLIKGSEKPS